MLALSMRLSEESGMFACRGDPDSRGKELLVVDLSEGDEDRRVNNLGNVVEEMRAAVLEHAQRHLRVVARQAVDPFNIGSGGQDLPAEEIPREFVSADGGTAVTPSRRMARPRLGSGSGASGGTRSWDLSGWRRKPC